jgi:crossover junction endodeoxyribonuclease RuvC
MAGDLILGVDPGLSGALALIDYASGGLVEVVDMPTHDFSKKTVLDEYGLARLLDEHAARIVEAWIEQPTPRAGQGVQQVATSLKNYGFVRGVIVANFVPLHDVAPAAWKRAMRVTGDKDEARAEASKAFPLASHFWALKKHDGRAEAALIAAYGRWVSFHKRTKGAADAA